MPSMFVTVPGERDPEVAPLLVLVRGDRRGPDVVARVDVGRRGPGVRALGVGGAEPAGRDVVEGVRRHGRDAAAGVAQLAEDAVVVLGAAHRHREDILRLRVPRRVERVDPEHAREERVDRAAHGDPQASVVGRILERRHGDAADAVRVAVLDGLGACRRDRGADVAGQVDHAREGRGVGRALHAQAVRPVPRHVDDDRAQADEQDDRHREDDDDLAALADASRETGGAGFSSRHSQVPGLRAMTVLSAMGMVAGPPPPKKPMTADSGVTRW